MRNSYKKKVMYVMLGLIVIFNGILFSLSFFSYVTILKQDNSQKISAITKQISNNISSVLSFYENEIEVFINKNGIIENLNSFEINNTYSIKIDNNSFDEIAIFKNKDLVFLNKITNERYYRNLSLNRGEEFTAKNSTSGWFFDTIDDLTFEFNKALHYQRILYDAKTGNEIGIVIGTISAEKLSKHLLSTIDNLIDKQHSFTPVSIGMAIDEKIFLKEGIIKEENINLNKKYSIVSGKTVCVTDIGQEEKIITIYGMELVTGFLVKLILLIVSNFCISVLLAYKILKCILEIICSRLGQLDKKIVNYYLGEGEESEKNQEIYK